MFKPAQSEWRKQKLSIERDIRIAKYAGVGLIVYLIAINVLWH